MGKQKEQYDFDPREPDVEDLQGDYDRMVAELGWWVNQAEKNRDLRYNMWAGKTDDGRKHGEDAFPWDNASDLEPMLTNTIIDADVAMLKGALSRSNLVASPVESGDLKTAELVTQFMRWLFFTQMEELQREAGIAANCMLEKGLAVMGVYWKRNVRRVYRELSLEELLANFPEVAEDPDGLENLSTNLYQLFPQLKKNRIERMAKELREEGVTNYPTEVLSENRPSIRTYELGREIVFDPNITDLQEARTIYCVHWYTPEALRDKVISDGWDEDWVDECIKMGAGGHYEMPDTSRLANIANGFENVDLGAGSGLIRTIQAYRKEIDEDGVPLLSTTIFSTRVEGYASYDVVNYDPVRYPFVALTRESLSPRLLNSRGIPELLRSSELAIKTELDSRRDRASLSTVPPIEYMAGRAPKTIGPAAKIPVRRRGEVGFMEIPKQTAASAEIENSIRNQALKVVGRPTSELDAVEANQIRQGLVNDWLFGWKQILKQVWALQRQYGDPEVWFRVTNNQEGAQLIADNTAEVYDFEISWDVQNSDKEVMLMKMEKIGQVMAQYDRNGQANFGEFMKSFIEAIDPNLASRLIIPQETATMKEVEETSDDIAKIYSGQVVNAPQNANPQLRMQVIENWMKGTEEIPNLEIQQRMENDESFRARIETYVGQLQHQQQQAQNALTGQLGTPAGNVPASS
jgi:hypothetical protein